MDFKISLKSARVNANMTQSEVAEKLGITRETIIAYEKGKTPLKPYHIMLFSELYGIPADNIFLPEKTT